jgi:hypothetical protein
LLKGGGIRCDAVQAQEGGEAGEGEIGNCLAARNVVNHCVVHLACGQVSFANSLASPPKSELWLVCNTRSAQNAARNLSLDDDPKLNICPR